MLMVRVTYSQFTHLAIKPRIYSPSTQKHNHFPNRKPIDKSVLCLRTSTSFTPTSSYMCCHENPPKTMLQKCRNVVYQQVVYTCFGCMHVLKISIKYSFITIFLFLLNKNLKVKFLFKKKV